MPREIVTVQVGQCGNQMGVKWWDVVLQEHRSHPQYPEARESLFHTVSSNSGKEGLKARCVAVDMEEGVLQGLLRGPLKQLFDSNFFVSDVSGAGNNWAVGHMEYGDKYIDSISDAVRLQVEQCECIQSFQVMHSLSGGTGSGLGTRVLGMLEDEFPHVFRICPVVLPSNTSDDVVTAPYNSCFALRELIEHADCVLPIDNDSLSQMVDRSLGCVKTIGTGDRGSPVSTVGIPQVRSYVAAQPTKTKGLPYDSMNAMIAQLLSNLTCPMRFPGPLNMDINEITTNLVPYTRLHMLTAAIAPLSVAKHSSVGTRSIDEMFSSCLEKEHQFVDLHCSDEDGMGGGGQAIKDKTLATALIARGPQITVGDLNRNIGKLRDRLSLVYWNEDGFKTALCGVSPLGHKDSVLMLSNNCAIARKVQIMHRRFMKLYSVRSHVHHYEQFLELPFFDSTADLLKTMIDDYSYLSTSVPPTKMPKSMRELVYF